MGYSFNYCDAVGELYDEFAKTGADLSFGRTPSEDYKYVNSKAEIEEGKLILYGMCFDEDNEADKTEDRAKQWVAQLKGGGFM